MDKLLEVLANIINDTRDKKNLNNPLLFIGTFFFISSITFLIISVYIKNETFGKLGEVTFYIFSIVLFMYLIGYGEKKREEKEMILPEIYEIRNALKEKYKKDKTIKVFNTKGRDWGGYLINIKNNNNDITIGYSINKDEIENFYIYSSDSEIINKINNNFKNNKITDEKYIKNYTDEKYIKNTIIPKDSTEIKNKDTDNILKLIESYIEILKNLENEKIDGK